MSVVSPGGRAASARRVPPFPLAPRTGRSPSKQVVVAPPCRAEGLGGHPLAASSGPWADHTAGSEGWPRAPLRAPPCVGLGGRTPFW